jgi:very-short-patch-repair endonuclease
MTHHYNNPKIFTISRTLRHNQTPAEARLWSMLRSHRLNDIHFRRQHIIGNYIVDFCAPHLKLIIELDGSQHLDQQDYDASRTAYLESKGYRILRFWNNEVIQNIECVLDVILDTIERKQ